MKFQLIIILFLLGLNDLDHCQVIYTILFTQFILRTVTFSLLPQNVLQVKTLLFWGLQGKSRPTAHLTVNEGQNKSKLAWEANSTTFICNNSDMATTHYLEIYR